MKKTSFGFYYLVAFLLISQNSFSQTYAEKLGYPKDAKVIIFHVDDAGMSYEANDGTILSMDQGAANSCSVMMPCSWVPDYFSYLKDHPDTDAGVHLTLTSEWKGYRWAPVSGGLATPTLVDTHGYLWPSVRDVVTHGDPEELYSEIKAQVDKFIAMGFQPTHLDSHMGTLFASEAFLKKYLQMGMEYQIPVMFPGGHATWIQQESNASSLNVEQLQAIGKTLWDAGLPVLDDLHTDSYSWKIDPSIEGDDDKIQAYKTDKFIETVRMLQPGVTQIILHATNSTPHFELISPSASLRKGDMLAMMDPKFQQFLVDEGIILTTWRELMERRKQVK
ncbi:MAG TPA: polysaccharide deacetylase family protein [Lunatimonas sp.]|nr:polysaccharide deacetylase family protein [Lunatimonas sp.]